MSDISDSREVVNRSILEACLTERVEFYWQSNWTLLIDMEGIDRVLGRLADEVRVLGFDTFTLEGKTVYPRLDYMDDFGDGVATASAAAAITDWPRDTGLWVEVVAEMAHDGSA